MITKEGFLQESNGHGNRYSSYMLIGKYLTIEQVVSALNNVKDPFWGSLDEGQVVDGVLTKGKDGYNAVSFTISKGAVELIHDLTEKLDCIGYADTAWDAYYMVASKNGEEFDGFTAKWEDGCPLDREEPDEDGATYWDAFVELTDTASGITFNTGAGCVDDDTKDYYGDIIAQHRPAA